MSATATVDLGGHECEVTLFDDGNGNVDFKYKFTDPDCAVISQDSIGGRPSRQRNCN